MRARHCRGIVYAVPNHRDRVMACDQLFYGRYFVLGEEFRANLIDTDLGRHSFGRGGVVACQHDNFLDPLRMQAGDDALCIRTDPVPQFQHTVDSGGIANCNERAACPFDPVAQICGNLRAKPFVLGKPVRAQPNRLTVQVALKTTTRHRSSFVGGNDLHPVPFRPTQNRPCEWMRRPCLER